MKGYIAFIKKEFVENLKNYRFFILFTIFAIFGLSSAFLAKFTPEIIEALGAGFEATEEPVALDAWQQFYKNISGVGFSALIILFGSKFQFAVVECEVEQGRGTGVYHGDGSVVACPCVIGGTFQKADVVHVDGSGYLFFHFFRFGGDNQ